MASTALMEMMLSKALLKSDIFKDEFVTDARVNAIVSGAGPYTPIDYLINSKLGWMLSREENYARALIDATSYEQQLGNWVSDGVYGYYPWVWTYDINTASSSPQAEGLPIVSADLSAGESSWLFKALNRSLGDGLSLTLRPDDDIMPYDIVFLGGERGSRITSFLKCLPSIPWNMTMEDSWKLPLLGVPTNTAYATGEETKFSIDGAYVGDASKYVFRLRFNYD